MYWFELKDALLYGQPQLTYEMVQPEALKMAVREIARLVDFGWIDTLTDDALQRIQTACLLGHCPEVWQNFHYGNADLLARSQQHLFS